MVLGYSTSYFLGKQWSQTPLYAEKIIPLLDYTLSNNYQYSDKISIAFYELINKYQNTTALPLESAKEFIREQGYGYVLDLLNPNDSRIKILLYLIVLIHHYKDTKKGLELVFSLFQTEDLQQTTITQWYESLPIGNENTFKVYSQIDISTTGNNFFNNFSNFIKNYVYAELEELRIQYTTNTQITYQPYVRMNIHYISKSAELD